MLEAQRMELRHAQSQLRGVPGVVQADSVAPRNAHMMDVFNIPKGSQDSGAAHAVATSVFEGQALDGSRAAKAVAGASGAPRQGTHQLIFSPFPRSS